MENWTVIHGSVLRAATTAGLKASNHKKRVLNVLVNFNFCFCIICRSLSTINRRGGTNTANTAESHHEMDIFNEACEDENFDAIYDHLDVEDDSDDERRHHSGKLKTHETKSAKPSA